jgi:tRNA1(Val) A37 N6-methylase TrmN6
MTVTSTRRLFPTRFRDESEIRRVVRACHDRIFADDGLDPAASFDELLKVLVAKVFDEFNGLNRFFPRATVAETYDQVAALYDEAQSRAFTNLISDSLALGASTVNEIVHLTHAYSFTEPPLEQDGADLFGAVFQTVVTSTFRGSLGAYFTPRTVAEFVGALLAPRTGDTVVDPACGSGSLLLATLLQEQKPTLEGMDINPRMARVCALNLWLQGQDPRNVRLGDSLVSTPWSSDSVDFVVANPPFAGYETRPEVLTRFDCAANGARGPRSLNKTIPFVEMIIRMLRPGGKAGLVLPISILNGEEISFRHLRSFILRTCRVLAVVGLPSEAFQHTDCGVAGALLFVERTASPRRDAYDVFVATADTVGYDSLGRPIPENDLVTILDEYRSGWSAGRAVSSAEIEHDDRLDPTWWSDSNRRLRGALGRDQGQLVALSSLFEIRREALDRLRLGAVGGQRFFEVRDTDPEFGLITSAHVASAEQLRRKGRIKQYVRTGDVLLPNHRDSLVSGAAGGNGRSAVLVTEEWDGALTTDRFVVLTPKIDPYLLISYLNSPEVRAQLAMLARGSASLDVRDTALSNVLVPDPAYLPPQFVTALIEKRSSFMRMKHAIEAERRELQEMASAAAGHVRARGM